jgi:uncharacterized protein (TIGR02145 family)
MKTKINIWFSLLFVFGVIIMLTNSCKKDDNNSTIKVVPVLTTSDLSNITQVAATCGGNITNDGGVTVTARGVCWSTSTTPTITNNKTTDGIGVGVYTSQITGLTANTTYYVRAYATNDIGTSYGNSITLKTYTGTVTDDDGNIYNTVTIGTQVWMVENLKTTVTKYGNAIPLVTDVTAWGNLTTPGFCWYNNDENTYKNTYGALYNWYAVNTGRLCPFDWHVPTDTEWTILTTYLGGDSVAGNKLRETGIIHWANPNIGATNETGFTALPGGYRYYLGSFGGITYVGQWWSSSEEGYHRYLGRADPFYRDCVRHESGNSVRCVKD